MQLSTNTFHPADFSSSSDLCHQVSQWNESIEPKLQGEQKPLSTATQRSSKAILSETLLAQVHLLKGQPK
jgi:hypothetical protein